tara:strand:- start:221 stop:598 length:378 start_codon:yes stop_codon:yes gene_type:complete
MAHFAKLGIGNKVLTVEVVHNDVAPTEQAGMDFLNKTYGTNDLWKQTSYNTKAGVHLLDGTPFRKNFAGIGYKYDMYKDAFIPPQPFSSWVLNEESCIWEAPVAKPDDGQKYDWNEETQQWDVDS